MKNCKKILALLLVTLFALTLCACESSADKMAALAGTYTMTAVDSEEQVMTLLESIEAYDEEIALADMNSLEYVQQVVFDAEGNYYFVNDADATLECVRRFYEGYFADLYEGRTTLNEVYDYAFDDLTEAEFQQLYADIYGLENYSVLIDTLVENSYDYETLSTPWETGTYTIKFGKIYCTITGTTTEEALGYELNGDTLKLIYSNLEEVYTKVN